MIEKKAIDRLKKVREKDPDLIKERQRQWAEIYYSKKSFQKLCKSFYFFLFKLFKINFYNNSEQYINELLEPFGLSSFQYRFITKIL